MRLTFFFVDNRKDKMYLYFSKEDYLESLKPKKLPEALKPPEVVVEKTPESDLTPKKKGKKDVVVADADVIGVGLLSSTGYKRSSNWSEVLGNGTYGMVLPTSVATEAMKIIPVDHYGFASIHFLRELFWMADPALNDVAVPFRDFFRYKYNPTEKSVVPLPKRSYVSENIAFCADTKDPNPMRFWAFVMERGEHSLHHWIYSRKTKPVEEIHSMCLQVLRVLFTMHHRGHVSHLDIKPSNILVMSDGSVRMCDGGSSRLNVKGYKCGSITPVITTLFYRAPEMHREKHFTEMADVWSVGCLLYEMYASMSMFYVSNDEELSALFRQKFPIVSESLEEKLEQYKTTRGAAALFLKRQTSPRLPESFVHSKLLFISGHTTHRELVVHCILSCLQEDPSRRPTLESLFHVFEFIAKS